MNEKTRFKMYKKGRMWITCMLTVVFVSVAVVDQVSASNMVSENSDSQSVSSEDVDKNQISTTDTLDNTEGVSNHVSTDVNGDNSTNTDVLNSNDENEVSTTNSSRDTAEESSNHDATNSSSESSTNSDALDSNNKNETSAADTSTNDDSIINDTNDTSSSSITDNSQDELAGKSYVAMGDSISQGWDGETTVSNPYPKQVASILKLEQNGSTDYAIGGAMMDGTSSSDFPQRVDALLEDKNFNSYDIITIGYGTNDYAYGSHSLVEIQQTMITQINRIIAANKNIKIYGILPISSYKFGGTDNLGSAKFSENDLLDAEIEVYKSFGIPYLDWRTDPVVTDQNYKTTLSNDSKNNTHPTQETYNIIAQRVALFIENNLPSTLDIHESKMIAVPRFMGLVHNTVDNVWYMFDDQGNKVTGLQTITANNYDDFDENSQTITTVTNKTSGKIVMYFNPKDGVAVKNTLEHVNGNWYYFGNDAIAETGMVNVSGDFYYFDSTTYEAVTNQFVQQYGHTYYFGSDGRIVQGSVAIDGKAYYFGDDSTFYERGTASGYLKDVTTGTYYWFENGSKYTGFKNYMGSFYYFINGVRQDNQFVQAWGHTYYVGSDGRAMQGVHVVNGKAYDFGSNGTYYARGTVDGYLKDETSGNYYWFESGNKYTGFKNYMGSFYYFINGVRQDNQFVQAWGHTYYVGSDGRAMQGVHVVNGKAYDFGSNGTYYARGTVDGYLKDETSGNYYWFENGNKYTGFKNYMGSFYYFINGVRQDNQFVQAWGKTYFVGPDGRAVQGVCTIDGNWYDFGTDNTYYAR